MYYSGMKHTSLFAQFWLFSFGHNEQVKNCTYLTSPLYQKDFCLSISFFYTSSRLRIGHFAEIIFSLYFPGFLWFNELKDRVSFHNLSFPKSSSFES